MTEISEKETQELINILDKIEKTIKEKRQTCTEEWQIELLDEIEKELPKKKEE